MERYKSLSPEAAVCQILSDMVHPAPHVNVDGQVEMPAHYRMRLHGGMEVYRVFEGAVGFYSCSPLLTKAGNHIANLK